MGRKVTEASCNRGEYLNQAGRLSFITHNVAVQLDEPLFHLKIVVEMCNYGSVYYLLTGCKGRTRKYKPKVFDTARACEGCLENQGLVFLGTARAPS